MPTDPAALADELARRNLVMLGAFVPVAMKNREARAPGAATAVKIAHLLAAVGSSPSPYLVLADDNGSDPVRTHLAGRVTPEAGLTPPEWKTFAAGADLVARAVYEETGLRTVFRPVHKRERERERREREGGGGGGSGREEGRERERGRGGGAGRGGRAGAGRGGGRAGRGERFFFFFFLRGAGTVHMGACTLNRLHFACRRPSS